MSSSKHPPNDSDSEDDPDYVPTKEVGMYKNDCFLVVGLIRCMVDSESDEGEGDTNEIKEDKPTVTEEEESAKKRCV